MYFSSQIKKSISTFVVVVALALPLIAQSASVVSVEGKVEVSRNGKWVALAANDKVSVGEVISTGFKSKAVLRYQGSVMQLGSLTRITIDKLAQESEVDSVNVYLNTGAIKSTVNKVENKRVNYTVRNPVAVASVRGTEFLVLSNGYASCDNGSVWVTPANYIVNEAQSNSASIVVSKGENASVSVSRVESTAAQTSENTARAVLAATLTPADTESIKTGSSVQQIQNAEVFETNLAAVKVKVMIDDDDED